MLLKFCGITRQEDLNVANELGADMCGFIFHAGSPRYIHPDKVAKLRTGKMLRVGVFTTNDLAFIKKCQISARLDLIQLHGSQSTELATGLNPNSIIKVFWPQSCTSAQLQAQIDDWRGNCAFILLDAGKNGGGSGQTLPWKELTKLHIHVPWFLAGGLSPDNLSDAIAGCLPDGVDLNSGMEVAPGIKNHSLMRKARNLINKER